MKTINGLIVLELYDIIRESGGRPEVCKKLLYHAHDLLSLFKDNELITLDTRPGGNLTVHHLDQPYKFHLATKTLLEEKVIADAVIKALEDASVFIQSEPQKGKISRIIEQHRHHYDLIAGDHTIRSVKESPSYVFAAIGDNIVDVFTTTPATLISVISRPVVYELDSDTPRWHYADPTSPEGFIPELFYKEDRGKTTYYNNPVKGSRPVGQ